jgi:hypothetical protein
VDRVVAKRQTMQWSVQRQQNIMCSKHGVEEKCVRSGTRLLGAPRNSESHFKSY